MSKYTPVPDYAEYSDQDELELDNTPSGQSGSETTAKDTYSDSDSDDQLFSPMGRRKTWKNICTLAAVFILLFMAFNGLVDLQSSLFIDEGMGVITQSVVYASFSMSCLVFPKFIISKLGHKWTISLSTSGYLLWMAANGYATWFTMTTTSFLVGLCAAPLWTAQTTYITHLAESYAKSTRKPIEPTVALFFGVFHGLFQIAAFCGNVISWTVLKQEQYNIMINLTEHDLETCGASDCATSNATEKNAHFKKVPDPILWSLVGIYLFIGIMGLLISIFLLDDIRSKKRTRPKATVGIKESVRAALRHHKDIRHWLIIPMTVSGAMEMVFIWADFNKSYVTCAIGVWMVGLVFLPSVVLSGISALSVGKLSTYIPHPVFMLIVFLINGVVLCFLLFWRPNPDDIFVFFLVPGLMGLAGGTMNVMMNSLVALTFKDQETAFACVRLWGALGAAIAFGINRFLCVRHKIYINCVMLVVWFSCYVALEVILRRRTPSSKRSR